MHSLSEFKPQEAYELSRFINDGLNTEMNIKKTSMLVKIGDVVRTSDCIFDIYSDFIESNSIIVNLTDKEIIKYKYQPKILSLHLYGTLELWYLLLKLNRISTCSEFDKKKIKVFNPNKLDLLNKILMLNETKIKENHYDVLEINL